MATVGCRLSAVGEPPAPGLSAMLYAALAAVGGQVYLARQAEENPRAFLTLIGKLLAAELRPAAKRRSRHAEKPDETACSIAHQLNDKVEPVRQAEEDPRGFLALLGKVLTTELRPAKQGRNAEPAHAATSSVVAPLNAVTDPVASDSVPASNAAPTLSHDTSAEIKAAARPVHQVTPHQAQQHAPSAKSLAADGKPPCSPTPPHGGRSLRRPWSPPAPACLR